MTVKMTSEYNAIRGVMNTLTADSTDVVRFDSDGSQLRITFKGGVNEATLTGYVRACDLEDKDKYWSTPMLIRQIDGWANSLEELSKSYALQGGSALAYANNYAQQVSVLRLLLRDLRNGEDVWEE